MPRLVGKKSNGGAYAALLLLVAAGTVTALEYAGVTDAIPVFGRDYMGEPGLPTSDGQPGTTDAPVDTSTNQPNAAQ